jgi:hypothetical protein
MKSLVHNYKKYYLSKGMEIITSLQMAELKKSDSGDSFFFSYKNYLRYFVAS